ncbi:MAG: Crp/Fnr family transcriptional regulator, partial [Cyanobacteria bacterium J06629_2]
MKKVNQQLQNSEPENNLDRLTQHNFLFRGLDSTLITKHLEPEQLIIEKLYSSRPIYTAFRPDAALEHLYVVIDGGPIVVRSTPLDRIIAITYSD